MKTTLLYMVSLLISAQSSSKIDFTLADPQPEILTVYGGSLLSGDLDDDGDIDLIQTGIGTNLQGKSARATVFLNDGMGSFTEKKQSILSGSSVENMVLKDLDNDNDLDVIISTITRTDFYRNDGKANFTLDTLSSFKPSYAGELMADDVDGDGDFDILHFGQKDRKLEAFVALYLNDGKGFFTQAQNSVFIPLYLAKIELIDLEGDGDKDVLSFGRNDQGEPKVALYKNEGSGNYSVQTTSNIGPFSADEISVGDVDKDGDEDFLITGTDSIAKTILYLNDGKGQFSELLNTPFPNVSSSSNGFADLDNDNDLDLVIIGSMTGGIPNIHSIVFENLGDNKFVAVDSLIGEYITTHTIADFNGDGAQDIIIQGIRKNTNVYWGLDNRITNLALSEKFNEASWSNLGSGQFNIKHGITHATNLEVYSLKGRLIEELELFGAGKVSLDLGSYPKGIYLVKIFNSEKETSILQVFKK
ncbi:T9SS type A sorting domain-containing protein [Fibrobacterales bacterium]|nr:T9SS type A sorting domain-containing protein [Fibrobacterales bacterium]